MKDPLRPVQQAGALLGERIAMPAHPGGGQGRSRLADWLAQISTTTAGNALAQLLREIPAAEQMLAAFAENAPYLWSLANADPARLLTLLDSPPELRLKDILTQAAQSAAGVQDDGGIM